MTTTTNHNIHALHSSTSRRRNNRPGHRHYKEEHLTINNNTIHKEQTKHTSNCNNHALLLIKICKTRLPWILLVLTSTFIYHMCYYGYYQGLYHSSTNSDMNYLAVVVRDEEYPVVAVDAVNGSNSNPYSNYPSTDKAIQQKQSQQKPLEGEIEIEGGHYSNNRDDSDSYRFNEISNVNVDLGTTIVNQYNPDRNPLLPSHMIMVTGLESSGTRYVTAALAYAFGLKKEQRKGKKPNMENFHNRVNGKRDENGKKGIELMHLSLPHGFWCTHIPTKSIESEYNTTDLRSTYVNWTEPVQHPDECVCKRDLINGKRADSARYGIERAPPKALDEHPIGADCPMWKILYRHSDEKYCKELGIMNPVDYSPRSFFNITSNIRWYQEHGTRATAVIVLREQSIELVSKINDHCANKTLARAENEYGIELIKDALDALSMPNFFKINNSTGMSSQKIIEEVPSMILLSYEMMVTLGASYLNTNLFSKLGLENPQPIPHIFDANDRYIKHNYTKPGGGTADHKNVKMRLMIADRKKQALENRRKVQSSHANQLHNKASLLHVEK